MDLGTVGFDFVWAELKRVLRANFSECVRTLSSGRNHCESSAFVGKTVDRGHCEVLCFWDKVLPPAKLRKKPKLLTLILIL